MRVRLRPDRGRRALALMLIAAAAVAAAGALLLPARTVAQATPSTPTVTVTPSSNISDGQYVVIAFQGVGSGAAFDVRQCIQTPSTVSTDCTALLAINGTPVTAIADNKGKGNAYVPVYSGSDQLLENDGHTGPITCDNNNHPCTVALMPDPATLNGAFLTQISFAPSANLCPNPGANGVVGSGSATAYRAMYQWEAAVCQAPTSLPVTYTLKNSPDGVLSFLSGTTQFGVTGPWAPDYIPTSTATPPQTWDYAPVTMSGLVLAYRMYDLRGPQITTLTLTPAEIAAIFTGSLTIASDPGVAALNPGIQFPSVLNTYVRAEHSAESWVFTSWLSKVAPTVWTYGAKEIFPATSGVTQATGSAAVALGVLANPLGGGIFRGSGTVGFMDSSTAAYYGLPTIAIANADGTSTPATAATIARAVNEATLNTDGTVTPGSADQAAWPMLVPTYMMVPTNNVTPATGKVIADFLRYAVQGGQSATTLPPGYAPLTGSMTGKSISAAEAIPVTAPASPTPSPTPTPVVSTLLPHSSSFGSGALLPPLPSTPTAAGSPAAATPASSANSAPALPGSPPLALAGQGAPLTLPVTGALAAMLLLTGLGLEAFNQVSRRRSRPALQPQGPP